MVQLSPLSFDPLQIPQICLNELLGILNSISGNNHVLVLQRDLSNKLNLLTPFNVLKEKGKIMSALWLEDDINTNIIASNISNINSFVILCENGIANTELIDRRIKQLYSVNPKFKFNGIITNEVSSGFEFRLEQLGIKGDIQLHSWDLKASVLDHDLLSLDLDSKLIKTLYLDNLNEPMSMMASSLLNLVNLFPTLLKFNNILLKGNKSVKFYEIFTNLKNEYLSSLNPIQRRENEMLEKASILNINISKKGSGSTNIESQFSDLIVLERGLDFVTPLLSQLTYLGLVDELYDFEANVVNLANESIFSEDEAPKTTVSNAEEVDTQSSQPSPAHTKMHPKQIKQMNFDFQNDEIFQKIKDLNFAAVGPVLNKYAKALQEELDSRHNFKKISQVKEFVGKLSTLQKSQFNLKSHTLLAENILVKVKGKSPTIDDGLQVIDEDEDEDSDNLFPKTLELQQSILDGYYDLKKSVDSIINLIYEYNSDLNRTLKLCCLLSKVNKGIPEKYYHLLKNEIITNYGIRHLITLQNLNKMKLFYVKESISYLLPLASAGSDDVSKAKNNGDDAEFVVSYIKDFSSIKNYLNLIPSEYDSDIQNSQNISNSQPDPENPHDASFAYPNFVPITTRIIQSAYDRSFMNSSLSTYLTKSHSRYLSSTPSWKGIDELWKFIAGDQLETSYYSDKPGNLPNAKGISGTKPTNDEQSLCFIVFIGGITYGEVATLRYIEKKLQNKGINKRFVILTDGIINGDKLIEAFLPDSIGDC
ncbi:tethering complex ATP-binding subunit [Saccharomycopsis crataegensis]|uniref:Tethering complex ATP-binding subunit n=1 Tax=Saccharomycopsis crataegensis TaxID=43959 RepID=A0AAV5QKF4_9ASCO|nr:tethering complex ATP-binding subunit [Saccharomycopsis crataegensis]